MAIIQNNVIKLIQIVHEKLLQSLISKIKYCPRKNNLQTDFTGAIMLGQDSFDQAL